MIFFSIGIVEEQFVEIHIKFSNIFSQSSNFVSRAMTLASLTFVHHKLYEFTSSLASSEMCNAVPCFYLLMACKVYTLNLLKLTPTLQMVNV